MRWRLHLSEFNFDIQDIKGIRNCQTDALSRLRTSAEAVTTNAKLDIHTSEEHNADSLNLVHSEFATDDQLLVSQVECSGDVYNSPNDLPTFVQEQIHDLFCRQIHERLNTVLDLPFQLIYNGILQHTAQPSPVIVILKSL